MNHIQKQLFETQDETGNCMLAPPASAGPVTPLSNSYAECRLECCTHHLQVLKLAWSTAFL